ncbi:hypothetical protein [Methylobacter sp. BlB1]|uniref:hypothetical protein n=1 Tax=Methylobacter sp. BlB1 TaxID=2785914 RepID=UPI001E31B462|nr:hypothetical protein [Methylobacter sp. BlB1]
MNFRIRQLIVLAALCLASLNGLAGQRIAVLDFELKDLTLAPGIPSEVERTAVCIQPYHLALFLL